MITTTQNKQIKQIIKLKKSARERRKQEFIKILKKFKNEIEIKEEKDYERYGLLVFGMINTFYINNLFPCENRFVETSLTEVKNKISRK